MQEEEKKNEEFYYARYGNMCSKTISVAKMLFYFSYFTYEFLLRNKTSTTWRHWGKNLKIIA